VLRRDLPGGAHLRLLEECDAEELFALVDRDRAHLHPWMPWVRSTRGTPEILAFIRSTRRQIADNNGIQTAIVVEGEIAGVVGFHRVDWASASSSIGYWLAAEHEGRGTMTQAVRVLVEHAFGPWRLERVEIAAALANRRSRAVAERLGFREEGIRRRGERHGLRYVDLVVYGARRADWRAREG